MTTADAPTPSPPDSVEDYNLAERVYGGDTPRADESGGGDPRADESGGGDRSPARSNGRGTLPVDTVEGNQPTDGQGVLASADRASADRTAIAPTEERNLAESVYGNGLSDRDADRAGDRSPADSNGDNGGSGGRYNLAERVYGNDRPLSAEPRPDVRLASVQPAVEAAPSPAGGRVAAAAMATLAPDARRRGPGPPGTGLASRTFDSLQVPAFRWFMLAMLGQFNAMNMQMLVRGYLVFELTGSFAALGAMSLANAVPMLVFSLAGGVLADRAPRKLVLAAGQLANAGLAAVIAVLLFTDLLRFEHLIASAVLQGFVWSMMMPARQAMIPEIVGEERLMNAVSLNVAGMNFMRLVAPGVGGLMIAVLGGADWVYVVIASSFLLATVALMPIQLQPAAAGSGRSGSSAPATRGGGGGFGGGGSSGGGGGIGGGSVRDLVDGLRYVRRNRTVLTLLVVNLVIVLFSMPYMMLLPGFVAEVLGGGAGQLGLLMTVSGVGALAGSLVIASMPARNRGKILLLSSVVLGVALVAFSASQWLWLTALIMVVIGVAQTGRMSISNVLLQAYVENEYRGRVMSIYMMEFGIVSFGVFFVGILASIVGGSYAIGGTAVALIIVSVGVLLFVPRLRNLD